ncbi:MAG TPA: hypothetical protein VIW80_20120 [Pyrinomonadaceae bacterium]|jgi:hypothetical protein
MFVKRDTLIYGMAGKYLKLGAANGLQPFELIKFSVGERAHKVALKVEKFNGNIRHRSVKLRASIRLLISADPAQHSTFRQTDSENGSEVRCL